LRSEPAILSWLSKNKGFAGLGHREWLPAFLGCLSSLSSCIWTNSSFAGSHGTDSPPGLQSDGPNHSSSATLGSPRATGCGRQQQSRKVDEVCLAIPLLTQNPESSVHCKNPNPC
jgi:hypothetical protein